MLDGLQCFPFCSCQRFSVWGEGESKLNMINSHTAKTQSTKAFVLLNGLKYIVKNDTSHSLGYFDIWIFVASYYIGSSVHVQTKGEIYFKWCRFCFLAFWTVEAALCILEVNKVELFELVLVWAGWASVDPWVLLRRWFLVRLKYT